MRACLLEILILWETSFGSELCLFPFLLAGWMKLRDRRCQFSEIVETD